MWPVLHVVEFGSVSSEGSWRIKKDKKDRKTRIVVKPKSADDYVGWPLTGQYLFAVYQPFPCVQILL